MNSIVMMAFVTIIGSAHAAELFDRHAMITGRVPAEIRLDRAVDDGSLIRVIREYANCLKIDLRGTGPWAVTFGEIDVAAGDYSASLSIGIVPEAGQLATQDIANFRPENQARVKEDVSNRGRGTLTIVAREGDSEKLLATITLSPTPWKVFSTTFAVPQGVHRITAKLSGDSGGIFYVADLRIASGKSAPVVTLPSAESLNRIQGFDQIEPKTLIAPQQKYSLYEPGQTLGWTVAAPADASFKTFSWVVVDSAGKALADGQSPFGQTVQYRPTDVGYYELIVTGTSDTDPSRSFLDWQGAGVLTPTKPYSAGSHPFGLQCAPPELCRIVGACWVRDGLTSWFQDINEIPADTDYSVRIRDYRDNHVQPLHHSNNITGKTNSDVPGDVNHLPKDFAAYEGSYEKLARLGGNFVEHFEIWNEPEGRFGATPYWTIENFAKTLTAAHRGMKRANPSAKLGIGSALDVAEGVHKCGAADAYEFLILHPYPWAVGGPWNPPEEGLVLELCASTRQWLDMHSGKDKELWPTEYGYTTGTTQCGCSESEQAEMIVRATLLQLAGGLSRVNPFRTDDVWFWGQVDGRFGLCRWGLVSPKPSLVAYATTIRAIRDLPYRGHINVGMDVGAFVFGNADETVIACWTTRAAASISLPVVAGSQLIQQFGQTTDIVSSTASVALDHTVKYLAVPQSVDAFIATQKDRFVAGFHGGMFNTRVQRKECTIARVATPPAIDGDISEWSGPAIHINLPAQDVDATVRAAIDDENLYLMYRLRGRTGGQNPNDGGHLWAGDCLEFYFAAEEKDRPMGYYRDNDHHFAIAPGTDGHIGKVADVVVGRPSEVPGANARYVARAEGGYDLEAVIPLKALNVTNVRVGDRYGFDVQICPSETTPPYPRRAQLTWCGTGKNSISPYLWGSARVVEPEKSSATDAAETAK